MNVSISKTKTVFTEENKENSRHTSAQTAGAGNAAQHPDRHV
jgi:hypothetical protein